MLPPYDGFSDHPGWVQGGEADGDLREVRVESLLQRNTTGANRGPGYGPARLAMNSSFTTEFARLTNLCHPGVVAMAYGTCTVMLFRRDLDTAPIVKCLGQISLRQRSQTSLLREGTCCPEIFSVAARVSCALYSQYDFTAANIYYYSQSRTEDGKPRVRSGKCLGVWTPAGCRHAHRPTLPA